jgi:hypothetical protein
MSPTSVITVEWPAQILYVARAWREVVKAAGCYDVRVSRGTPGRTAVVFPYVLHVSLIRTQVTAVASRYCFLCFVLRTLQQSQVSNFCNVFAELKQNCNSLQVLRSCMEFDEIYLYIFCIYAVSLKVWVRTWWAGVSFSGTVFLYYRVLWKYG